VGPQRRQIGATFASLRSAVPNRMILGILSEDRSEEIDVEIDEADLCVLIEQATAFLVGRLRERGK